MFKIKILLVLKIFFNSIHLTDQTKIQRNTYGRHERLYSNFHEFSMISKIIWDFKDFNHFKEFIDFNENEEFWEITRMSVIFSTL